MSHKTSNDLIDLDQIPVWICVEFPQNEGVLQMKGRPAHLIAEGEPQWNLEPYSQ